MKLYQKMPWRKGYGMLEPDVAKVASPVLRGAGVGNGLRLLGKVSRTF